MRIRAPLLLLAVTATLSLPVQAINHYIETPTESIVLQDSKCKTGGFEATLIEKRPNGLVGYGCWELREGQVQVRWTTSIGPTGSVLPTNFVAKYPTPKSLFTESSVQRPGPDKGLVDRLDALKEQCRGGRGDMPATVQACKRRDDLIAKLEESGWCWGPPEASQIEKRWLRCK